MVALQQVRRVRQPTSLTCREEQFADIHKGVEHCQTLLIRFYCRPWLGLKIPSFLVAAWQKSTNEKNINFLFYDFSCNVIQSNWRHRSLL